MATPSQFMPFMAEHEVRAVEACLASFEGAIEALEWGAGRSTLYFATALPPGSRWDAIEHDLHWATSVRRELAARQLAHVALHHIPNDGPFRDGVDDGDLASFHSYVLHAARLGRLFDFILVDGRARVECLRLGWELLAENGVLALHDAQRGEYTPGVPLEADLLRLSRRGPENATALLFAAQGPDRLDALERQLTPLLPSDVRLTRAPGVPRPGALRITAGCELGTCRDPEPAAAAAAEPACGAPSCVFVNTYYPDFLRSHYRDRPGLADASYAEQHAALQQRFFGDSDFYSCGLRTAGFAAHDLIVNCDPLQASWAREEGIVGEGLGVAVAQIARAQPDVVYLQDLSLANKAFIEAIRPHVRLIAGQIASQVPEHADLRLLDLVVSSFPHFARDFQARGLTAHYQPLAFEPRILEVLPGGPRDLPLTFVGGLSQAHTWRKGTGLIETLASETPIAIWGYGARTLSPESQVRQRWRGEAWGLDMFSLLRRSRVTVNRHSEVADRFANNMRLFEATGSGALLITDHKDNLDELFRVGEEVVTYRSPEECIALTRYFLAHEDEAGAIAKAGQERTLREHTYARRMAQTAEILGSHLRRHRRGRAVRPPAQTISTPIQPLTPGDDGAALADAWKDPAIPARQRALVEAELDDMYQGRVVAPFQAMADALRPFARRGDKVLEVGCSSGYYREVLEFLLGLDLSYTGVDYSPAFVDMARAHYPRAAFEVADGARLPYKEGAFDVAISSCVLLHVIDWEAHAVEAVRVASRYVVAHRTPVCRKGSTAIFRKKAYGADTVELRFREEELLAAFERRGVRLIRAVQLSSDAQRDEHWMTYVFARPGAPIPLS